MLNYSFKWRKTPQESFRNRKKVTTASIYEKTFANVTKSGS